MPESEIVEFASDRAAAVIEKHRDRISEYQAVCDMLLGRLWDLQDHAVNIEAFLEAVRNEDNARAVDQLWKALSLPEQAKTINQLVQALTKLIEAERKALTWMRPQATRTLQAVSLSRCRRRLGYGRLRSFESCQAWSSKNQILAIGGDWANQRFRIYITLMSLKETGIQENC